MSACKREHVKVSERQCEAQIEVYHEQLSTLYYKYTWTIRLGPVELKGIQRVAELATLSLN